MAEIKRIIGSAIRLVRALVAAPADLSPALTEDDVATDRFLRRHPQAKRSPRQPAAL